MPHECCSDYCMECGLAISHNAEATRLRSELDRQAAEIVALRKDAAKKVREIFSQRLNLHYDQRAYGWHEIQDALSEVDAALAQGEQACHR